jgi:AcrR family transcriptional regulator
MTGQEQPKRKYRSTRRHAQAEETRRQIILAARKIFALNGYSGATFEAIANEAGVAAETIFAVFGNKRAILKNLVDFSVGGDEQPVPVLKRPGPQAVFREPDVFRQLNLFSTDITQIIERIAPVFEILRMAAKTEPDIAELLQHLLAERLANMQILAHSLSSHRQFREGMDDQKAAEILWAITSPELFQLLTIDRGWTRERYISWLEDALSRLLFD